METQEIIDVLRAAESALASSYQVCDYPADGQSDQDIALARVRSAIKALSPAQRAP